MKIILALLLTALTASAQYRFTIYSATIATNAAITSSNSAVYNQAFDVGSSTAAVIQVAFKNTVLTNATPATNSIISVWEESLDGSRYTNQFTFTLYGNNTTNTESWAYTNSAVTLPWLRLVALTNNTSARITNITVKVGKRF